MGLAEKYGAYYFKGEGVYKSRKDNLYSYTAYSGKHTIEVEQGDSLITVKDGVAHWIAGEATVEVDTFAAVIRGYQCGQKTASVGEQVNLPYVNGCATRQIFHPERVGDPTFQQLTIPPYTAEQMHHIHATPRVVYVLKGRGYSIVGQADNTEKTELTEGMLCVLDPMSPHHFETEDDYLTVLPVHIFSSTVLENNHPMFNGTKEV